MAHIPHTHNVPLRADANQKLTLKANKIFAPVRAPLNGVNYANDGKGKGKK
jgi:hypothetical protein